MVNVLNPVPLKAPELVMYACFGLIYLPHTEPRRVRLPVKWVNVKWNSPSTESTRSETPCQLSQRRRHQHLRRFHHSSLTQLTWSLTPRWFSRRGVSLDVDSVDGEWDSHQLSHRLMLKHLNKLANSRTKSKTLKSLIIWPWYVWSVQKNGTKI
jgi:hypothetical protein